MGLVNRAGSTIAIGVIALITMTGCGASGGGQDSALTAAESFYNAALAGELAEACSIVVGSDGEPLVQGTSEFASCAAGLDEQQTYFNVGYGIDKVTVSTATINGTEATVTADDLTGLPEGVQGEDGFALYFSTLHLAQIGDRWYVSELG